MGRMRLRQLDNLSVNSYCREAKNPAAAARAMNSPAIGCWISKRQAFGNWCRDERTSLYRRSWIWPLLSTTSDTSLPFFIALTAVPSAVDLMSRICE